jgi:phosphoribosylformimino-5-aminoimidazole carboxamide ribotide isomerase
MFRPCIDLHEGKVKQIVGGTLTGAPGDLRTNFVSERPASWFAALYRRDNLFGGHIVMLGPGNQAEARGALKAFPGGMRIGGGINPENAAGYLDAGASHIIVTSWIFPQGELDEARLRQLSNAVGKRRLVLDLSCRKRDGNYCVVTDRWQKFTSMTIEPRTLERLAAWCDEFLVHAADAEGLCSGVDFDLAAKLAQGSPIPATYAGGANALSDLEEVTRIGRGRIHLTIGSALDIFGGKGVRYQDAVQFNRTQKL